jgi:hypothetical protein
MNIGSRTVISPKIRPKIYTSVIKWLKEKIDILGNFVQTFSSQNWHFSAYCVDFLVRAREDWQKWNWIRKAETTSTQGIKIKGNPKAGKRLGNQNGGKCKSKKNVDRTRCLSDSHFAILCKIMAGFILGFITNDTLHALRPLWKKSLMNPKTVLEIKP